MSRRFSDTAQSVFSTTLPVSSYPFTFSIWWRGYSAVTPIANHCSLLNLGNASQGTDYISLCLSFDASSNTQDAVSFQIRKGSAGIFSAINVYVNSTGTFDYNDTWHHFCATITASKEASLYWKGTEKNTLTTSITDYSNIAANVLRIGARPTSAQSFPARGYLAHPAIWDVALEDSEVLALASGLTPLQVRPQNLKFYTPYLGRNTSDIDIAGKIALTTSGTTASPEEPRIRWPTRARTHSIDWAINSKEATEEAMILDSVLPSRRRLRIQAESSTLSDALITSRLRGRLSSESSTLVDAFTDSRLRGRLSSEGSTIEDALLESSFRNRDSLEGATLADFVLESSFRNRASSESISNVADAILLSASRSRIAADGIVALDEALRSILRTRLVGDFSTLIDEFISTVTTSGPTIYAFTATETLTLIDLAIEQLSLSRVSSDALVAEDALILSALRRRILSEAATATDESLRQVTRNRILLDAAVIVDASVTSAQRNRASSESASVTDQSLASRQANRTASDSVAIAEAVARSLSRAIFTSDLLTVADATLLVRQLTAQVSEALSISEIIAKSMILSSYFDVRVLLGTLAKNTETVLGSSESISLSASDSPKLGSYS